MVVVPCQVLLVDVEVVVGVQFPELTVDDIKMFIREEVCQLVDVVLLLQQRHVLSRTDNVRNTEGVYL